MVMKWGRLESDWVALHPVEFEFIFFGVVSVFLYFLSL
jgi:hypothetical protein